MAQAMHISIRVVNAFPMEPINIAEVENMFKKFGQIDSVSERFNETDENPYYCVQFSNEDDAKSALSSELCDDFEMKAADLLHQPNHPLQIPPSEDCNIVNTLNKHCIQEIFKYLNVFDLKNVADVCVRFNEQAKIVFASEKKDLVLNFGFHYRWNMIVDALKLFGKFIETLYIDAALFQSEAIAIQTIAENCGTKLQGLELFAFSFQENLDALRPVFGGIHKLKFMWCSGSANLDQLLAQCIHLESLSLNNCHSQTSYTLGQFFPQLNELNLYRTTMHGIDFEHFIIRHNQTLKKLSIDTSLDLHALNTIGQHARNLNELKFVQNFSGNRYTQIQVRNESAHLGQLNSLSKVHIDLGWIAIDPIVEILSARQPMPISDLNVAFMGPSIDFVVASISKMKQIKKIELHTKSHTDRVSDQHVLSLVKNLPQLKELYVKESHDYNYIYPNYQYKSSLTVVGLKEMISAAGELQMLKLTSINNIRIDVDDYYAMLRTVQKRLKKLALAIEIHGFSSSVDVAADVLAHNQNTLKILHYNL